MILAAELTDMYLLRTKNIYLSGVAKHAIGQRARTLVRKEMLRQGVFRNDQHRQTGKGLSQSIPGIDQRIKARSLTAALHLHIYVPAKAYMHPGSQKTQRHEQGQISIYSAFQQRHQSCRSDRT